ncbi:hypothetical protein BCV69DRAFT_297652 [Microstroma glucosiphilum]|uniref:Mitochondrial DNA polymerase catalytic subunit n=1 Tax=Pseudomicrostroma glucosiphilum TaxID=1684307 RepID=A0A316UAW1_9BASI|nr:hypothetical protein BCV69DRAFT_297652 [Pseudomicrostroma glucosiphilum]PWN22360.1 hypothetical protein BCV69DRAFT_297652 [Pseudomicrostroma glucosiphilum]
MATRASLRPWLNTRLPYASSSSPSDRPYIRSSVSSARIWRSWAEPSQAGPSKYATSAAGGSAYSTAVGSPRHTDQSGTNAPYHESLRRPAKAQTSRTQKQGLKLPSTSTGEKSEEAPRNPLGVQLLAPGFSAQIFPPTSDPPPPLHSHAVSLSHAHLASHGLSPSQGSKLKSTDFPLPPLQGRDLGEHFWNLGREAAQPWLSLSEDLAGAALLEPPSELATSQERLAEVDDDGRPSPSHWVSMDASLRAMMDPRAAQWLRRSGWTKYPVLTSADGRDSILGEGEAVPYPDPSDGALVFDVETMVTAGPYSVMACAAGPKAWYSWISPWLLGETDRKDQLIPFGGDGKERLLVGHNVSYDRARIRDEYRLRQSNIRFLDTLSLHVAVRGMSSPQRPAWIQHRKNRAQKAAEKLLNDQQLRDEQRQELLKLLGGEEVDATGLGSLGDLGLDLEALWDMHSPTDSVMPLPLSADGEVTSFKDSDVGSTGQLQWQDISSTNSLADVASLYCDIQLPKELRNIFVDAKDRREILDELNNLLNYCARDVSVTHAVFSKVLPAFRETCPHPATFAGVLALGSPILPVDDEWVQYQERCQQKYEDALKGVRIALIELAEGLRMTHSVKCEEGEPKWWTTDPWLSQLDWTPKKPKKVKLSPDKDDDESDKVPRWYRDLVLGPRPPSTAQGTAAEMLLLTLDGQPIVKQDGKWFAGAELLPSMPTSKQFLLSDAGRTVRSALGEEGEAVLTAVREKLPKAEVSERLRAAAELVLAQSGSNSSLRTKLDALDWTTVHAPVPEDEASTTSGSEEVTWPKWYWDLFKSATGLLELTIRTKIAPLLLKVSWRGCPLYHSREHGWIYQHRISENTDFSTRQKPLVFKHEADSALQEMSADVKAANSVQFYKVPHSAGDDANVGSPFSKSFVGYFEDQTLRSEHPDAMGKQTAKDALELNAQCSYWVGVRDRVANQMVVWEGEGDSAMGIEPGTSGMRIGEAEAARQKGLILPQIITMGTITRRAIEKTWLTASNAKKNRVGSELKAMVKAPPGWVIVGADVDSEELWICSVMGDAQFGLHGATAVGWMTLEGTKSAGTDLHSKTASILGTSRNQAKIFNYSRIYGAGIRHATQLLLKANPAMLRGEATRLAKELYATTKGNNTHSADSFGRKFWFGGTESFVFNKLEDVALSERPRTPALDCGITAALSRKFLPKAQFGNGRFGEDFMPSRINWVVQSSGVDYLHLLVTSMNHLCKHYDIAARFMLSVHDEVRYLAEEKDAHRAALALQIANLWTRAMFAYKLQMEDLPEGVAWFAQVDIDKVLRKEVDDPCVTPSQPEPIPHGKAYEIAETLDLTHGGSLYKDGRPMGSEGRRAGLETGAYPPYVPSDQKHRSLGERGMLFLQAQASGDIHEIRALERRAQGLESRSAESGDVMRPTQADLIDVSSKRGGKAEAKKRTYQKKTSQPMPRRAAPPLQSSSKASLDRKEASSARLAQGSVRYSSTSAHEVVASSLLELAHAIPVRRRAPIIVEDSGRYWELPGYSSYVRWQLYRQLLRNYPKRYRRHLRRAIRSRFRLLSGHDTSAATALRNIERAETLLRLFKAANARQDGAREALHKLTAEREERYRLFKEGLARHAAKGTGRRPHILTGSLLRPHTSHGPLLRVKPPQPKISMMILHRRLGRTRRIHRGYELLAEKDMLSQEGNFYKGLLSQVLEPRKRENVDRPQLPRQSGRPVYKPRTVQRAEAAAARQIRIAKKKERSDLLDDLNKFGPGFTWYGPISDWQKEQTQSFKRDSERANAQYTPEMLMKAKAARRTHHAYLTMKAEKRRQQKAAANVKETTTGQA